MELSTLLTHWFYGRANNNDEYLLLEKNYLRKIKEIMGKISIDVMLDKIHMVNFYKRYKEGKDYICECIQSDSIYIIKYLAVTAKYWNSQAIEITEEYKEFITKEQVENAIDDIINSGRFNDMNKDMQRIVAAFIMKQEDEYKGDIIIDTEIIDQRVLEIKHSRK